eukprot:CAMPEP_0174721810 /NCGR_PEP_ID=MMETSP1094-20130205/37235_1 /TAXON_ID=156173 /ORGANISM="Chrysochromulina brevifilum, Strain UTEX LB 985" /LENGTH=698 /DNA_ID=CAMNT_0015922569 /DNA_START=19 /DNA_END=2115 /DNA_ORIENTATION=+
MMAGWAVLASLSAEGHDHTVTTMSPFEKRTHFAKVHRLGCTHGHAGGAIFSVSHDNHFESFRASLVDRGEKVTHSWPHLRMVAARSIRADTLEAAFDHEHTRHIEPNCIMKRDLPKPANPKETAQIFEGTWVSTEGCANKISVRRSWSRTTTPGSLIGFAPASSKSNTKSLKNKGTVHSGSGDGGNKPSAKPQCDGVTDVASSPVSIWVNMTSLNHGYIQTIKAGVRTDTGVISMDAMGNMIDKIDWQGGEVWTRMPSASAYDKESNVGPNVDFSNGVESRNYEASPRWNWGLDRLDSGTADLDDTYHFGNATGEGAVLYHLDTGVMGAHDDFEGRVHAGYSAGCPTGSEKECAEGWIHGGILTSDYIKYYLPLIGVKFSDHGTHTMSTALGAKYGVAKKATGYAVQVLDSSGSGSTIDLMDGMVWSTLHHSNHSASPSVMTMSLGMDSRSKLLSMVIKSANAHGVLVVVAAGNDATDACTESPASVQEAVTVAASGITNADDGMYNWKPQDTLASFSNYGSCVNIIAPGQEILAAYSSDGSTHLTASLDGTSMATPLVAGVALTIRAQHPYLSPADTTRALICTAELDTVGGKNYNPYTANRMLQGGQQVVRASELIASQQELTVQQRVAGVTPTWDATHCHSRQADAIAVEPVTQMKESQMRQLMRLGGRRKAEGQAGLERSAGPTRGKEAAVLQP